MKRQSDEKNTEKIEDEVKKFNIFNRRPERKDKK